MISDVVIIIPAYNPDNKFLIFLSELKAFGYEKIIVVNDGSREETLHFFKEAKEKYDCNIVTHNVNLGQGRAYKSGFNCYLGGYWDDTIGVIQCDCDGQHTVEDVTRCAELLRKYPDEFILGVRSFDKKTIPLRSRFGNKITEYVFSFLCGLRITDTQTGLKGIPKMMVPRLMEVKGERFEYASSVLLETRDMGITIHEFPIKTIYIDHNASSHFDPIRDSIRIYSLILKYLLSSFSAFILDIVAFSFFSVIIRQIYVSYHILIATFLARIISCTYTYLLNKKYVFKNTENHKQTFFKFILLCVAQAMLSGVIVNSFVVVSRWNELICKIIVDTLLFFVSFQVQNKWVFKGKKEIVVYEKTIGHM